MPYKLKDLEVTKVDFVTAGANPRAHIMLYKNKKPAAPPGPPVEGGEPQNRLQKALAEIAKYLGLTSSTSDGATTPDVAKAQEAVTFDEQMAQENQRKITGQIWDVGYALTESLCSIICDDNVPTTEKAAMMERSLGEFATTLRDLIPIWTDGNAADLAKSAVDQQAPGRLELLQDARDRLDSLIKAEQAAPAAQPNTDMEEGCPQPFFDATMKGESDMKFDKSKMAPEELALLEGFEKKYGMEETAPPVPAGTPPEVAPTPASAVIVAEKSQETPGVDDDGDIYKGLHPAVAAELQHLRKAADAAENRELTELAKKYEIIGKKPEELVPTLKALKAAGGDAFAQMIQVLDASVAAVEKSGVFSEIGKSGTGGTSDAWTAIEKHADELMKAAPGMTRAQAVDKACEQHPELVHDYENSL